MARNIVLEQVKAALFPGRILPSQASGVALLMEACRNNGLGETDAPLLAYVLATAFHETGGLMQPVRERGGAAYLRQRYDVTGSNPARARANGNIRPGDGALYAGRGYVQITWKANYERVGAHLGIDLVNEPDRALEPGLAATILVRGMAEGWFTGRKLGDYMRAGTLDFVQARRVVNGLDRAVLIASYAEAVLRAAASTPAATRPRPSSPLPSHPQPSL